MLGLSSMILAQVGPGLRGLDWTIIVVFLIISTIVAIISKGRQEGVEDFFLARRNLPWFAVCLSLMATEISAASFVGVPFSAFSGSLVYIQLALGAIIARILIGYYFVPAFYRAEASSPYHYVGMKLGLGAERMTRLLFIIGAVLGQAVRVLMVAIVLQLIAGIPVVWSIYGITGFAALWAVIGGIRSVVWTDVLQFVVLVVAALAAGIYLVMETTGGFGEIFRQASEASKLRVFDFRLDQMLELTIWTGIFGSTFNALASHGADQMNTQRILSCRSAAQARLAVLWSSLSQLFVFLLLCIGISLWCYYSEHAAELKEYSFGIPRHQIFPIFIATVLPAGLKGLLVIGLFAASISSLNSALAALAQTTTRSLYSRGADSDGPEQVKLARLLTLAWGVGLAVVAWYFSILFLFDIVIASALKTTSFTYGALLGALLLAFMPHKRDGRGLLFSIPIAVLAAFGMSQHADWTHWMVVVGVSLVLAGWCYMLFHEAEELANISNHDQYVRRAWYILLAEFPRTIWIIAGAGVVLYLHFGTFYRQGTEPISNVIAWPWYLPTGTGITVLLGYLLSRPRDAEARIFDQHP